MSATALDGDCLRAVLCRLPQADLIRNVSLKLASREFSDALAFALNASATREPITLSICMSMEEHLVLYCCVADVAVSNDCKKAATLEHSGILELISGIHFEDRGLPESKQSTDVTDQLLAAIFRKLVAVRRVTLRLQWNLYVEQGGSRSFYAFARLLSPDVPFLPNLASFQLLSDSATSPMFCKLIRNDFVELMQATTLLAELSLPVVFFARTADVTATDAVWARLSKLSLKDIGNYQRDSISSCQKVLQLVCKVCPNLSHLSYNCNSANTTFCGNSCCGREKGCICDFTCLLQLAKLSTLWLEFGASASHKRRFELPVLENVECLRVTGRPRFSCDQLFELVDMTPNVKRLHLAEIDDSLRGVFEQLGHRLAFGRLPKLECLAVDAYLKSLEMLRLVTAIDAPLLLRHVRFATQLDCDTPHGRLCCDADGDSTSYPACRADFACVQDAIANACNVVQLRLRLCWHDSYLKLEQTLVAMATGSIVWLDVDVDWHQRYSYELDQRLVKAILPEGCELREWNVFEQNGFPDSVVIRGRKQRPNDAADLSPKLNLAVDTPEYFWVRLQRSDGCKSYCD